MLRNDVVAEALAIYSGDKSAAITADDKANAINTALVGLLVGGAVGGSHGGDFKDRVRNVAMYGAGGAAAGGLGGLLAPKALGAVNVNIPVGSDRSIAVNGRQAAGALLNSVRESNAPRNAAIGGLAAGTIGAIAGASQGRDLDDRISRALRYGLSTGTVGAATSAGVLGLAENFKALGDIKKRTTNYITDEINKKDIRHFLAKEMTRDPVTGAYKNAAVSSLTESAVSSNYTDKEPGLLESLTDRIVQSPASAVETLPATAIGGTLAAGNWAKHRAIAPSKIDMFTAGLSTLPEAQQRIVRDHLFLTDPNHASFTNAEHLRQMMPAFDSPFGKAKSFLGRIIKKGPTSKPWQAVTPSPDMLTLHDFTVGENAKNIDSAKSILREKVLKLVRAGKLSRGEAKGKILSFLREAIPTFDKNSLPQKVKNPQSEARVRKLIQQYQEMKTPTAESPVKLTKSDIRRIGETGRANSIELRSKSVPSLGLRNKSLVGAGLLVDLLRHRAFMKEEANKKQVQLTAELNKLRRAFLADAANKGLVKYKS